jgi:hypothetical protein
MYYIKIVDCSRTRGGKGEMHMAAQLTSMPQMFGSTFITSNST